MNYGATPRAKIAAGALNTFIEHAVARPTESGLFSRPDYRDGAAYAVPAYRFGRGESHIRKDWGTACSVFRTSPRPSFARLNAEDGLQSRHGATAMQSQSPITSITSTTGVVSPVITDKPQRQPDGTMRVPGHLSFTHEVTTVRGKWLNEVHFDSQPMTYYVGQREGMRRAAELLACIKAHKPEKLNTKKIIAAAFGVELPRATFSKPTADNVASGFIDMIVRMVESAAKTNNHAAYIEQAIAHSFESEAWMTGYERDRHQKTATKAAATRAARRAAKGVEA